ncbi:hypothetical protein PshuTeo1_36360 [Pseudomonas hunanensis]|uniref:hypothetical protein n=1 Tax=Pseudomonas putida TaxID=303 RepID=UPI000AF528B9|nr:hypothetical protein [Pseudomonas putida]WPE27909.1 hypothetical protein PshuTeo1_36360 [Pseudomonas hunanensis]
MESMLDILPKWAWATWALMSTAVAVLSANKWIVSVLKWLFTKLFPPKRVKILWREHSHGGGIFARMAQSAAANGHTEFFFDATVVTLDKPVMIHKLSIVTLEGEQFFARQDGMKGFMSEALDRRILQSDQYKHAFKGTGQGIFSPIVAIRVEFSDGGVVIERPKGLLKYAQGLKRLRAKQKRRPAA